MTLGKRYLTLMNLANQACDRKTYHQLVDQAQKLLQDDSPDSNHPVTIISSGIESAEQEAA